MIISLLGGFLSGGYCPGGGGGGTFVQGLMSCSPLGLHIPVIHYSTACQLLVLSNQETIHIHLSNMLFDQRYKTTFK